MNHETCVRSYFTVPIFYRVWNEYGDLRISPRFPSEYREIREIRARPSPKCKHFSSSRHQIIATLFLHHCIANLQFQVG